MMPRINRVMAVFPLLLSVIALELIFSVSTTKANPLPPKQAVLQLGRDIILSEEAGVSIGDFNGDGKLDLVMMVIATSDGLPKLAAFLGDGFGGFAPPQYLSFNFKEFGGIISAMTVANFNQDQFADLIIGANLGGKVTVLLGNKNGILSSSYSIDTHYKAFINTVCVADFNRDGRQDILISSQGSESVSVYSDLGNGALAKIAETVIPETQFPGEIGDVNGDGNIDIVFPISTNGSIEIFLNEGTGTFFRSGSMTDGTLPLLIRIADIDKSKKPKLLSLEPERGAIKIRARDNDGGFNQPPISLITSKAPISLATGDIDGDGIIDIATASFAEDKLTIFWGKKTSDGAVSFPEKFEINIGEAPVAMSLADVNNDSKLDILTTEGGSRACN